MDAQLPLSVHTQPAASGGSSKVATPKRKPAKPKPKATPRTLCFSFDVSTPKTYEQQLVLREQRHLDYITQDEANVPSETLNSLKRNFDIADNQSAEGSNKRAKTINGSAEAEVPGTTSGGKVLTVSKPARRNVGGRPRIHPLKERSSKILHFLRKNYPVSQEIPADIWNKIFDFSPPEFLLQARQTNSLLRMLLIKESSWKKARLYTYGSDHPDPPLGLTEFQYADLLTGVGCQTRGCQEVQTRKVYWAFQRRWCLKCLKTNTKKETDVTTNVLEAYPWLPDCIPKVTFDSWNRYCWVGDPSQKPSWALNAGTHIRYSCSAMTLFTRDVDKLLAVGSKTEAAKTKDEKEAWVDERVKANRVLVENLQLIEAYAENEKKRKREQGGVIKAARKAFFKERALKLNPPLTGDALEMLPKYKASIEISKMPSERSWQELLPKIQEARAQAEKMIQKKKAIVENPDAQDLKYEQYKMMLEDRKQHTTTEQRFVLDLAEKEINEVHALVEAGSVAHVDFVPFVFRKIFEAYDSTHDTGKPGAYKGRPYCLVLDDARMVYTCLVSKIMDRWEDHAKIRAAKHLKCPGCKRKDSHRLHEFESLIKHIGVKHSEEVGALSYFRHRPLTGKIDIGIPWCRLRWPRNLPILASHREVVGEWDPEDDSEYIHVPSVVPRSLSHSAFEGRSVENGEDPPREDFIKNVLHAASLLDGIQLPTKYKTQIAFKYALDRHNSTPSNAGAESVVPVQDLKDLPTALIRAGIRGLFEGFRCLACRRDETREKRNNKFADKKQSLGELVKHFLDNHEHSSWSSSMFDLPSAEELWDALVTPGMEQAEQTFVSMFPETEEVLDLAAESSKTASLGLNLDQTTFPATSSPTYEQALVPAWRGALWTAGSSS